MAYAKTSWNNGGPPPINATNLNKIEQGISDGHDLAEAAQLGVDDLRGRFITAGGPPEGLVAAEPGSKYIDQVGTNGAWEWIKRTGDGVTGWEVSYGDTGWRRVLEYDSAGVHVYGATLPADWVPRATGASSTVVDVRRIGREVSIFLSEVEAGVSNPSGRIYVTTAGFNAAQQSAIRPLYMAGSVVGMHNGLNRPGPQSISAGAYFFGVEISYLTGNAWPTVLPGKAV